MENVRDERAAGVGPAMRRRIAAALDAGQTPALRGNNLRLGSIVLQRTSGRDTPALREVEAEMRRRNLPTDGAFNTFQEAAPVRRGRGSYATDTLGRQRMITRRVDGEGGQQWVQCLGAVAQPGHGEPGGRAVRLHRGEQVT